MLGMLAAGSIGAASGLAQGGIAAIGARKQRKAAEEAAKRNIAMGSQAKGQLRTLADLGTGALQSSTGDAIDSFGRYGQMADSTLQRAGQGATTELRRGTYSGIDAIKQGVGGANNMLAGSSAAAGSTLGGPLA